MAHKTIHIIDYGFGNLFSLTQAFSYLGAKTILAERPELLTGASAVVLPGVGAFGDGMRELKKRGFEKEVIRYAKTGRPLLGICLGMQFLFDYSEEFGKYNGLGLISGGVKRILAPDASCKVPHVGWNTLFPPGGKAHWKGTIFADIEPRDQVYFVHSYAGFPKNKEDILAEVSYCDTRITAAVRRDNIVGVQFHPEKSGEVGLSILRNFLSII